MGEWIRFHEVCASSGSLGPLKKLNLSILEGETLFIVGNRWSGKKLLRDILGGQAEISSGKLYLSEERWRKRNFAGEPILCVDRDCTLTQELSLKANLLSLQGNTREKKKFRRSLKNGDGIKELFGEMGISYSPSCPASLVPARECLLLWFVLAVVRGVRLLCLDCTGSSFSEEDFEAFRGAALSCKRRGIGLVIFDEKENLLMETADRIAQMERGQIQKIFYSPEEYRRLEEVPIPSLRDPIRRVTETVDIREGQILGIYDANWPFDCSLPEYLKEILRRQGQPLPDFLPMEGYNYREAVYIPEDSTGYLFGEQSIGRNLMVTSAELIGFRAGMVKKSFEKFLEREFCRKFEVEMPIESVDELTEGERKLLSVYRFVFQRPKVMLLENPFLNLDAEERKIFTKYLRELADTGIALVVSAKVPADLELLCDRIWKMKRREGDQL